MPEPLNQAEILEWLEARRDAYLKRALEVVETEHLDLAIVVELDHVIDGIRGGKRPAVYARKQNQESGASPLPGGIRRGT